MSPSTATRRLAWFHTPETAGSSLDRDARAAGPDCSCMVPIQKRPSRPARRHCCGCSSRCGLQPRRDGGSRRTGIKDVQPILGGDEERAVAQALRWRIHHLRHRHMKRSRRWRGRSGDGGSHRHIEPRQTDASRHPRKRSSPMASRLSTTQVTSRFSGRDSAHRAFSCVSVASGSMSPRPTRPGEIEIGRSQSASDTSFGERRVPRGNRLGQFAVAGRARSPPAGSP